MNSSNDPRTTLRGRTDTLPWYRQFWPWFLIALPLASVVLSFVTLALAIRGADVVLRVGSQVPARIDAERPNADASATREAAP